MKKAISIIMAICIIPGFSAHAVEKVNPDLGWVYEAVYEQRPEYYHNFYFSIPAFNIDSSDAQTLNADFLDYYDKIDKSWHYGSSYKEYEYNGLLSVLVTSKGDNDNDDIIARTINLSTGNAVSNSNLVAMAGFTDESFLDYLRNIIQENNAKSMNNRFMSPILMEEAYKPSLTDRYCNMDIPMYVSEEGHLMIMPYMASTAGLWQVNYDTGYMVLPQLLNGRTEVNDNPAISVILEGNELSFDTKPIIKDGRTLVPIRAIFEHMGYTVEWDQSSQTANAVRGNNSITVQLNNNIIKYVQNGTNGSYECDVAPQIVNDRILVPLRAIAESASCEVAWDGDAYTVKITQVTNEENASDNDTSDKYSKYIGNT